MMYEKVEGTKLGNKVWKHTEENLIFVEKEEDAIIEERELSKILDDFEREMVVLIKILPDSVEVYCMSKTRTVRALEYVDYLVGAEGIAKGNETYAWGKVAKLILKLKETGKHIEIGDIFKERAQMYFQTCDSVFAKTYASENAVTEYPVYKKKNIPWAVVKTIDIAEPGKEILIRTLETVTGVRVKASPEMYVMIGILGEVYHITKEKFNSTYVESEEEVDIFEQMLEFIPAVEVVEDGSYVAIDTIAHLCYPKKGNGIYATQLTERTKVFPVNMEDYYVGKEGDYLVVRRDDLQDVYIIQKDIFEETYEKTEI